MNKLLGVAIAFVAAASAATAQDTPQEIYTRPALPSREALDRLNLKIGWYTILPMDGPRDSIFSHQIAGNQFLVQTRSGLIILLDRDTGQTVWRSRIGVPYDVSHPLGFNNKSVFVTRGTWLYALERSTGIQQWSVNLPEAPTAGVVADEEQLYLCFPGGRALVHLLPEISRQIAALGPFGGNKNYMVPDSTGQIRPSSLYGGRVSDPNIGPLASAVIAMRSRGTGDQPALLRNLRVGTDVEQTPLLTPVDMIFTSADGTVTVLPKETNNPSAKPYKFLADGRISVQPAQYGQKMYIASHDGSLNAVDIPQGRAEWRLPGGNPILKRPAANNEDVYVAPEGSGLHRIDRVTGQVIWRNEAAHRFLAANPKFVYSADRHGRLMVLDRMRGTTLSVFDGTRDFNVPIINEFTDRIYLAAHNGLLVGLHDRDYETPVVMKKSDTELLGAPEQDRVKAGGERPATPAANPPMNELEKP
jgi:outer membrane protein assembly factor BamB